MNIKALLLFVLLFGSLSSVVAQQKVSDGTNPGSVLPVRDAILELESTNKGLLHVRLPLSRTTDPSPLSAHVAGMMVYNTATTTGTGGVTPGIYYNDGTQWVRVGSGSGSGGNATISYNPVTYVITFDDVNGDPQTINLRNVVRATETLTSLTDNGNGTVTFRDERGVENTIVLANGPAGKSALDIWRELVGNPTATAADFIAALRGADGVDGVAGVDGIDGVDGAAGVAGANGADGADGVDGKSALDIWRDLTGNPSATELDFIEALRGAAGADGKSAYQIAVDNGFVGNQAAWLASLVGAAGVAGADGADGAAGATGADGKSAYEIAVENGFAGDQASWLASLAGAAGANGIDGIDGVDGAAGADGKSAYQIAVDHGFVGDETAWLASLKGTAGSVVTIGGNGNWFIDGVDTGTPATGPVGATGADGADGSIVTIGGNGNWFIDGVDTGTPATGPVGATGADGVDGSVVTIGVNGNWFIDGVDTGTPATGPVGATGADGADGSVVTIGGNGNWFIDGVDTGTPATGPVGATGADGADGADGSVVTIGVNGNWFIDGVDTGTPATGPVGADGKSAYQVAVDNGFVGDETAWLASLKGDKGDKGDDGIGGVTQAGSNITITGTGTDADPYIINGVGYQTISHLNLVGNLLTITLENGGTKTVDLSGVNEDNQQIQAFDIAGDLLTITLEDGGTKTVDLAAYKQQLTAFDLDVDNILTITLADGGTKTVDLSGVNEDNQQIQQFTLDGDILKITLENGGGEKTIDLSKYSQNATQVTYANTSSGLTATNVQAAIDELVAEIANITIPSADLTVGGGIEFTTGTGEDAVLVATGIGIADGGVTTAKLDDAAVTPAKIEPGVNDQVLITDGIGNVAWINRADFAVAMANGDATVIGGDGTSGTPFKVNVRANNGLSISGDQQYVQLGGTLIKATVVTTDAANTLAIQGLQTGSSSDNLVVIDPVTGVLKQMNQPNSAQPNWFYMPPIIFDTSTTGTFNRNLYDEYKTQFSNPIASSAGAPAEIPYLPQATDLYYYVTYSDASITVNSISASGVMNYTVNSAASPAAYMTILFVVK